MSSWPDITGVTTTGGRAILPRQPSVVADLLREAASERVVTAAALVDQVHRRTGVERVRLEGLAGWLPLSRVARWSPDGILALHPETSPHDLGVRFAAWASSQALPADEVAAVQAYAHGVVQALHADRQRAGARADRPWIQVGERPEAAARPVAPLTARLQRVIRRFEGAFAERSEVIRAALLSMLAGRHVLLLGPPGTAKSQLARALCGVLREGVYFEYLLSRFTHPDELFGPVSIPGLKDEDYRRITEGFLPRAHVAFLDEIFKANSAILNSLLTLVNERTFHHGRHRDPVPLVAMVGASNELPEAEGGLSALYDRFLVRLNVPPVADPASFLAVATGALGEVVIPEEDRLSGADLAELRRLADEVVVPSEVRAALVQLWQVATERAWGVSDRRWRHAVDMLRVGAAAEGRTSVELLDLLLLQPVLAPEPGKMPEVGEVLVEQVAPRAVPRHDLRAQWALLHLDKVAPRAGEGLADIRPTEHEARLSLRKLHAERMVWHAEQAVGAVATDRERLERRGEGRVWVSRLPPRVLAAHLEAGRDLARILEAAERYLGALGVPARLAEVLLQGLPEPTRKDFGAGVVVRLHIEDIDLRVGLTMAGERMEPPREARPSGSEAGHLSRSGHRQVAFELEVFERAPELKMSSAEVLALISGGMPVEALTGRAAAWAQRNVGGALNRVIERLGGSAIPRPPALPDP